MTPWPRRRRGPALRDVVGHPVFLARNRGPVVDSDHRSCSIAEALALAELEAGAVSLQALADLGTTICISVELVRSGVGTEAGPVLVDAARLLRSVAPGQVMVAAGELAMLRQAIDVAQQLRRLATRGEFAAAVLAVGEAQRRARP